MVHVVEQMVVSVVELVLDIERQVAVVILVAEVLRLTLWVADLVDLSIQEQTRLILQALEKATVK